MWEIVFLLIIFFGGFLTFFIWGTVRVNKRITYDIGWRLVMSVIWGVLGFLFIGLPVIGFTTVISSLIKLFI